MASSSAGPSSQAADQELQDSLYARCTQAPTNALLKQSDLLAFGVIPNNSTDKLMQCVQALLKKNFLQVYNAGSETAFKVVKKETAEKYQKLSQDEALVFSTIEASGREGIWIRNLMYRTNIHQSNVRRALKSLEGRNWIRSVRSVKNPRQILYMLSTFTPSEEVTGGPWFTDGELDTSFVKEICDLIERYISSKSFYRSSSSGSTSTSKSQHQPHDHPIVKTEPSDTHPSGSGGGGGGGGGSSSKQRPAARDPLLPFPPGYTRYPTLKEIKNWLNASKITEVVLTEAHVERLLDVLYYDGRIEKVAEGTTYKAVRQVSGGKRGENRRGGGVGTAFTEAPCGRCPVFHLCEEGGPVSASNCEYFTEWLKF